MTIATQVNKVLYSGTGATVYPYTFKIFAATDLVVIRRAVDGVETTLTLTTHYTVSGVGSDNGGNVTLVGTQAASPPTTGEKLLVKRVLPLTQGTDWVENDDFPAQVIEDAVDRLVCMAQQLQEKMDRSLLEVAQTSTSTTVDPDQIALDAANSAASAAAAAASAALAATFNPALYVLSASKAVANGVASLDSGGQVPAAQLANAVISPTTIAFWSGGE